MTKPRHTTVKTLLATGAAFFLMSSLAVAQPPAGGKGKGARGNGERGAQDGAMGDPTDRASKMISEYDKNRDAELKVSELTAALTAQRQQRGGQLNGRGGQKGAGGPGQRQRGAGDAGQGQRGGQKGGVQRQRGGPGGQRGGAQGGQRGPAGRGGAQGAEPAQIATKLIAEFDKNGSEGLDVQELTVSIKAQRQSRGGRGGAETGGPSGKGGRGQAEGRRGPGKGDAAEAGQGRGPDDGRPGKGKGRAEREDTEPGTGVVPKRPGE